MMVLPLLRLLFLRVLFLRVLFLLATIVSAFMAANSAVSVIYSPWDPGIVFNERLRSDVALVAFVV
jgi:hypothetical protein